MCTKDIILRNSENRIKLIKVIHCFYVGNEGHCMIINIIMFQAPLNRRVLCEHGLSVLHSPGTHTQESFGVAFHL